MRFEASEFVRHCPSSTDPVAFKAIYTGKPIGSLETENLVVLDDQALHQVMSKAGLVGLKLVGIRSTPLTEIERADDVPMPFSAMLDRTQTRRSHLVTLSGTFGAIHLNFVRDGDALSFLAHLKRRIVPTAVQVEPGQPGVSDQLASLIRWHEAGQLSDEEFRRAKQRLLER